MNVIVVAGDGDTASIGGNHLIHTIRRNANLTVLCNNNEIYGLTGGQTGPTTPTRTKTLSSPAGNPNTPINLQGLVRSSPHSLYAKTTVYHQLHMRNVIREALEWDGFSFVDITSQCIENNGRRIGFASANEMLTFYRKTYKRAPKDAERLNPFEIGIVYPQAPQPRDGNGRTVTNGRPATSGRTTDTPPARVERPAALPEQPRAPLQSATDSPGAGGATAPTTGRSDEEKARRRAESQARLALMSKLSSEVKLRVAKGEIPLADALREAGIELPAELAGPATRDQRSGASAPADAPLPPGDVVTSATGAEPGTERRPTELEAQKAEAVAEARDLIGGAPGGDSRPALPRSAADVAPPSIERDLSDPKERRRAEAQKKLALMSRLSPEVKLRVARGELSLADALREAGIDPADLA